MAYVFPFFFWFHPFILWAAMTIKTETAAQMKDEKEEESHKIKS
jgi:hypothetical protein